MSLDLTTDRSKIPSLDESELIQAGHFQITKYSTPLVAGVLALLTGVLPNTGLGAIPRFDQLDKSQQGLAILGILLVIGMSVVGLSLVWSADIRARAQATAANLSLRALPAIFTVHAPAGAAGQGSGLWVTLRRTGPEDEYLVIGARTSGSLNEYLLAKGNDEPMWRSEEEVTSYQLKTAT
jgi:hypothetical protein